ncbi:MAG TPA: response regulator [Bryobacteraceae bacterium]|jgi:CheY-like chemotaxis protein|nr:response regulator [Bryobacteraceae bacterium]
MIVFFNSHTISVEPTSLPIPIRPGWLFSDKDTSGAGPANAQSVSPENQGATEAKLTLLIAEDNPTDVLLVKEAIKQYALPLDTFVVDDGQKALDFIERHEIDATAPVPDIILLDLNLPKRSGLEVLRQVRQSRKCANVAVVVFTSSDAAEDRNAVGALGITGYFRKPSQYEQFLQIGQVLKEVSANIRSKR